MVYKVACGYSDIVLSLISSLRPPTPQSYLNQIFNIEDGFNSQKVSAESYLDIPEDSRHLGYMIAFNHWLIVLQVNMPLFGITLLHKNLGMTSQFDICLSVHWNGATYIHLEQENFMRTPHYK